MTQATPSTVIELAVTNVDESPTIPFARILFAFDPWRSSILLVAGDKAGQWNAWYDQAIPLAEDRYETYLKERTNEEGGSRP